MEFGTRPLPCYPCPHQSVCCKYGTTLSEREALALSAKYGKSKIFKNAEGLWRTRVRKGRCVFNVNNSCSIHADPDYPVVCTEFPWFVGDPETPYPTELEMCPQLHGTPELIEAQALHKARKKKERELKKKAAATESTPVTVTPVVLSDDGR